MKVTIDLSLLHAHHETLVAKCRARGLPLDGDRLTLVARLVDEAVDRRIVVELDPPQQHVPELARSAETPATTKRPLRDMDPNVPLKRAKVERSVTQAPADLRFPAILSATPGASRHPPAGITDEPVLPSAGTSTLPASVWSVPEPRAELPEALEFDKCLSRAGKEVGNWSYQQQHTSMKPEEDQELHHVFPVIRTSSQGVGKSKAQWVSHYIPCCDLLACFFVLEVHRRSHRGCRCNPIVHPICLIGCPSNWDPARSSDGRSKDGRAMMAAMKSCTGRLVVCMSGIDGLVTDPSGLLNVLRPTCQRTSLFMWVDGDDWHLYSASSIVDALDHPQLASATDDDGVFDFVRQVTIVGTGKVFVAKGHLMKQSVLKTGRNSRLERLMRAPSNAPRDDDDSDVPAPVPGTEEAKRANRLAGIANRQHRILPVIPQRDDRGHFTCPELGCAVSAETVVELVRHIADTLIERRENCPFCAPERGQRFDYDDPDPRYNENVREHIKMHLAAPERVTCDVCGVEMNKKSLTTHKRRKHPAVGQASAPAQARPTCAPCKKVFGSKGALAKHEAEVHAEESEQCEHCGVMLRPALLDIHVAMCPALADQEGSVVRWAEKFAVMAKRD